MLWVNSQYEYFNLPMRGSTLDVYVYRFVALRRLSAKHEIKSFSIHFLSILNWERNKCLKMFGLKLNEYDKFSATCMFRETVVRHNFKYW